MVGNQDDVRVETEGEIAEPSEESSETEENSDVEDSSEGGEDNDADKNTSNFKAMSKALRETRKMLAEAKAEKDALRKALGLEAKKDEKKPSVNVDAGEMALFMVENPEAKAVKGEILNTMSRFKGMTMEEAFEFVKNTKPKESETKVDASFGKVSMPKKFDPATADMKDPSKYTNSQWLAILRAKGMFK
jgi:hypothetical protein